MNGYREKMKQGVRVRIIIDDGVVYGTGMGDWLAKLVQDGKDFIELIRYNPVLGMNSLRSPYLSFKRRFHEKYTVVDGRAAVLGGMNWGDKYAHDALPDAWRDTDVYLRGPVVDDIQRQFAQDFFLYSAINGQGIVSSNDDGAEFKRHYGNARAKAKPFDQDEPGHFPPPEIAGNDRIRYVPHKPYDDERPRLRMTNAVLLMLQHARDSIYWGCHSVRPPRIIAEALANAVSRGVRVHLITNSEKASKALFASGLYGWLHHRSHQHYYWLISHGIRLYEWTRRDGAFHSKNLVIDGEVASIGSYNIAPGSVFHHSESSVIIYGGNFPKLVQEQFANDLQYCREVSPDEVRLGLFQRLKRKVLVEPILRKNDREALIPSELIPPLALLR